MLFTKFYIADCIAPVIKPIDFIGSESIALATPVLKRRKKKFTTKAAQAATKAAAKATAEAVDVAEEATLKAKDEAAQVAKEADKVLKKPKKGPKKPQIKQTTAIVVVIYDSLLSGVRQGMHTQSGYYSHC